MKPIRKITNKVVLRSGLLLCAGSFAFVAALDSTAPRGGPALNVPENSAASAGTVLGDESKREVRQLPASVIVMDDNFEYRVVDFGVGQVQIRPALSDKDALSQPVFWTEFRVTNVSEHLLGVPRYSPSERGALTVLDNWGNYYQAWCPLVKNIWSLASLPVPPRKLGRYKPQESSLDLAVIPSEEFVKDIVELRIYLNRFPGDQVWHFFSLHDPMVRQRNLLKDQLKLPTFNFTVSTGEEVQPPLRLHR
jgi:hypothetical protein